MDWVRVKQRGYARADLKIHLLRRLPPCTASRYLSHEETSNWKVHLG